MIPLEQNQIENDDAKTLNEMLKSGELCNFISLSNLPGFILFSAMMTVKVSKMSDEDKSNFKYIPTSWLGAVWFIISVSKKLQGEVQSVLNEIDMNYTKAVPAIKLEDKSVIAVIPDITQDEEKMLEIAAYPVRGKNFYSIYPSENHPVSKNIMTLSDWYEYELQTASEIVINALDPDNNKEDAAVMQVLNSIGIDAMTGRSDSKKFN